MNSAANETASLPALGRCRDCRGPVFRMAGGRPTWRCDQCQSVADAAKKARRIAAAADYSTRSPVIQAAHKAVKDAVRRGEMAPASSLPCSDRNAGKQCNGRNALHHDDYARPLDVRCLCAFHHAWWHWNNRPENAGQTVKCRKRGCPARKLDGPRVWHCPEHEYRPPAREWGACGGWRLYGRYGVAGVTRCRVGFNVNAYLHYSDGRSKSVVRVHTPEELRTEMRRVYTLVTGLDVA